MDRRQALRVFIASARAGQQNSFGYILAANIQCWGYEAVILSSALSRYGSVQKSWDGRRATIGDVDTDVEGDVLLYDLDNAFPLSTLMAKERAVFADDIGLLLDDTMRLIIALSSHSVSRMALEQIGAVALLYKPFEMGHLQRYLRMLQGLLLEEVRPRLTRCVERRRILVVDDDVEVAHAVCQCLIDEPGYEVTVAYDGLEALEQCVTWRPDCIVTDLIMPWMNGYQFMRCLAVAAQRSAYPMPAFVVMSALTQLECPVNRSYLKDKIVVYVDKPFQIEHLLATVKQALGTFQLQDNKRRVSIKDALSDPKRN
jgi:CheY-like chemotaxis protein